jgi:hypothetical protein
VLRHGELHFLEIVMFLGAYLNELRHREGNYDVLIWNPETFTWVKLDSLQPQRDYEKK